MERLTGLHYGGNGHYMECSGTCESYKCADCDKLDDIVDKLGEYEDAEEQGLLVRLPCKVGDTVYVRDEVMEVDVVHEINFGHTSSGDLRLLFLCEMGASFYDNDVGKTVFLTREEVEAALKEV